MATRVHEVDRMLVVIVGVLLVTGIFVFTSAAFGLLEREGFSLARVLFTQLVLGFGGGLVACFLFYLRQSLTHIYIQLKS